MEAVKDAGDKAVARLAKVEVLDKFFGFKEIDALVRIYQGAYTHDEVFHLEFNFCMSLIWYDMEKTAYIERYQDIKRQLNTKK